MELEPFHFTLAKNGFYVYLQRKMLKEYEKRIAVSRAAGEYPAAGGGRF